MLCYEVICIAHLQNTGIGNATVCGIKIELLHAQKTKILEGPVKYQTPGNPTQEAIHRRSRRDRQEKRKVFKPPRDAGDILCRPSITLRSARLPIVTTYKNVHLKMLHASV